MKKIGVLFVCLGNICRSPLAEGIFQSKLEEEGLSDIFKVDSCGTAAYHVGSSPDPRSAANARQNGIELDHSARQFRASDFEQFDYILAMDRSNLRNIKSLEAGTSGFQLSLMRDFDPEDRGADVPDPYYGGERGFQEVFEILDRSTDNLLAHIKSQMD